jgi:frizzled protein 9/10
MTTMTVTMLSLLGATSTMLLPGVSALSLDNPHLAGRCEPVTIPMCMSMRYNMTRMPNLVGHNDQKEAAIQVNNDMIMNTSSGPAMVP